MSNLRHQLKDVLRLIDENLEEINEFKELSHKIDLAFEIIAKRIMYNEKRLENLEDKIINRGFMHLESRIMRIIKNETREFKNSLIDPTSPLKDIKEIKKE